MDRAGTTSFAPSPGPPATRTSRTPWVLAGVLGLVVVLLAVATVLLVNRRGDQSERREAQLALAAVQDPDGPAMRAASAAVEAVLSYDYTRLDADFAAAKATLTPEYAAKYSDFAERLVRPPATQVKAKVVARTQVLAPTEATTARRAVVLAFVDQTTTSAILDAPAVEQSRVTLTMLPVDGRWLLQDLVVTGSAPGGR